MSIPSQSDARRAFPLYPRWAPERERIDGPSESAPGQWEVCLPRPHPTHACYCWAPFHPAAVAVLLLILGSLPASLQAHRSLVLESLAAQHMEGVEPQVPANPALPWHWHALNEEVAWVLSSASPLRGAGGANGRHREFGARGIRGVYGRVGRTRRSVGSWAVSGGGGGPTAEGC
jgi:hypothetical protein